MKLKTNKVIDALLGVAIGDAVGVPYEFKSREEMAQSPATEMIGYGTYNQAPGTWSDDSSLTLCLAQALLAEYDLKKIAANFIAWKIVAYWAARGEVFDIGRTTAIAISRLEMILKAKDFEALKLLKYQGNEYDNGNGSLMRILPLLFYIKGKKASEQFEIIWEVSALTHRHIRAAMSCFIYLKLAEYLLNGEDKISSYEKTRKDVIELWQTIDFAASEQAHFERIIQNDISDLDHTSLKSGGYVIESLEASIWCLLKKDNYKDTILEAINLGHDTDTTAAIAGGLAGIYYGAEQMPEYWIASIARMEEIFDLGNKLNEIYC